MAGVEYTLGIFLHYELDRPREFLSQRLQQSSDNFSKSLLITFNFLPSNIRALVCINVFFLACEYPYGSLRSCCKVSIFLPQIQDELDTSSEIAWVVAGPYLLIIKL